MKTAIREVRLEMGRWPNQRRSQWTTFGIMFVLFPLLCWLAWWFVKR